MENFAEMGKMMIATVKRTKGSMLVYLATLAPEFASERERPFVPRMGFQRNVVQRLELLTRMVSFAVTRWMTIVTGRPVRATLIWA